MTLGVREHRVAGAGQRAARLRLGRRPHLHLLPLRHPQEALARLQVGWKIEREILATFYQIDTLIYLPWRKYSNSYIPLLS